MLLPALCSLAALEMLYVKEPMLRQLAMEASKAMAQTLDEAAVVIFVCPAVRSMYWASIVLVIQGVSKAHDVSLL